MDQLIQAIQNLIPSKYQPLALAILVLLPRGLYSWRNGGGLKEFLSAMFLGTNTPPPPPGVGTAVPSGPQATPSNKGPVLSILLAATLALSAGCSTNQSTTVYKSATAIQTTMETVMTAWGNFVSSGAATDAQRAQVAMAYNKYQLAILTVIDAESAVSTLSAGTDTNAISAAQGQLTNASAQVNQALNDLVSLVQSFGVKF